eukprot:g57679.t1
MARIKALEQGDERQRKIEELEEEAGKNKQVYETLWSLARQRRGKYLKTQYDQASWTLESIGLNPDEEEEMEERCRNKRQRTNYLFTTERKKSDKEEKDENEEEGPDFGVRHGRKRRRKEKKGCGEGMRCGGKDIYKVTCGRSNRVIRNPAEEDGEDEGTNKEISIRQTLRGQDGGWQSCTV